MINVITIQRRSLVVQRLAELLLVALWAAERAHSSEVQWEPAGESRPIRFENTMA